MSASLNMSVSQTMKTFTQPDLEDAAPPYEEVVTRIQAVEKQHSAPTTRQERQREAHDRRIQAVVTDYIEPHLASSAIDGIHHSIFILIPSKAITSDSNLTLVHKPSLPTNVIQLQENELRTDTWNSKAVADLQRALQLTLGPAPPILERIEPPLPPRTLPPTTTMSRLKMTLGMPGADRDPTGSTGQWQLGWKAEERQQGRSWPLAQHEVEVSAKLKDVAFRSETALGLLVTDTVKCVWIEIELGSV